MAGLFGNSNLVLVGKTQFCTVDSTSDLSAELTGGTQAVTLYTTSACWVNFTAIGEDTPAAAIPGAEKTPGDSFYLPASILMDVAVPPNTDGKRVKVAYKEDTGGSGGVLYITERRDT